MQILCGVCITVLKALECLLVTCIAGCSVCVCLVKGSG